MKEEKIEVYAYTNITDSMKEDFLAFCKNARTSDTDAAAINMYDEDWELQPHTLPYILEKTNRFSGKNGEFYILTANDIIVACGGVYRSEFNKSIAILGCRTWINDGYRNKMLSREHLLPAQKEWAINNGCIALAITFNDYNKNLIKTFQRVRLGEARTPREPKHLFYNNMHVLEFPVTIQYTKQWVAYEQIESDWSFDWTRLK